MDNAENNNWQHIQKKYKNSIVQITNYSGSFDLGQPYKSPDVDPSRGSGFLITEEGHVLTNAHVVDGSITITFRSQAAGNEDLDIDIIAICHHKDVALLKVPSHVLPLIKPFTPFTFGDDQLLEPTDPVLTGGFPLGKEKIKFTSGVLSGYETPDSDDGTSNQSYLQIDASINKGSSGGVLLNSKGEVVGINAAGYLSAQNVGFAIPARVVLSILRDMFVLENSEDILTTSPRLGVILQRVTIEHFLAMGITDEVEQIGERVKEVIPGTPLKGIKEGDIIQYIEYSDPYRDENSFNIDAYRDGLCIRCKAEPDTFIELSRHGDVKLYYNNIEQNFSKDRKVSIQEVLDTIPSGTPITVTVLRDGEKVTLKEVPFTNEERQGIGRVYPPFSPLDYLIFAGGVWVPLSTNIINMISDSRHICEFVPFRNRNEPRVMLSQIFPKTDLEQTKSFERSEIIETINGKRINTLDQMKAVIMKAFTNNFYIIIKMRSGNEITLNPTKIVEQDKNLHSQFSIKPDDFTSSLWLMK